MPGSRRSPPALVALWLLLALPGCGGGDVPRRALASSASWVATMRLLAEARRADAVPSTYARTLRRVADDALAEQARTLRDPASGASAADRAALAARRRAALATPLP